MTDPAESLLSIRGLTKTFVTDDRRRIQALRAVDLDVPAGGAVGIVGESGSGKSTLARVALRLVEPSAGSVTFQGRDLLGVPPRELRRLRRHIQMVFQDPFASINPRQQIGAMLAEPLIVHGLGDRAERRTKVAAMLEAVGLRAEDAVKFPHQFSGGQRQRLAIARAAILDPDLIVADEPVSALDVSIQSQILNLLSDLRADRGLALLLIAHDLAVVGQVCDRIAVMYLGQVVEHGSAEDVLLRPAHPYARALTGSVYRLAAGSAKPAQVLSGDPPDPAKPPTGCAFHPRCPMATAHCRGEAPSLLPRQTEQGPRTLACHLFEPAAA